jgi:hypothetical protein
VAPARLTAIAWTYLSLCRACAAGIAYDIALNHRRQPMGVMNAVYPTTALYLGPFGGNWQRHGPSRRPWQGATPGGKEVTPTKWMSPAKWSSRNRIKDEITARGENVYPTDVEIVLALLPAVAA